jgi:hypothetical protein
MSYLGKREQDIVLVAYDLNYQNRNYGNIVNLASLNIFTRLVMHLTH